MSDAHTPMFTVVVPLFDKAMYIEATLATIAAQSFQDYEVIVVDDGSSDDGPARAAAAGGRVRLVSQDNAGPGSARNRGIAEARGAWVAFIDADDLWTPDHLATLCRTIAACPEADLVASGFERGTAPSGANEITSSGRARYIDFFTEHALLWTSALAVRATALQTERFGSGWPGEDVELWTRLALRHRFAVHSARTAIYVQQTGGAMDSQDAASAVAIADQPIFATINRILEDPAFAARHAALRAYRNTLLIDYTRPALFSGQMALAREYLRTLRRNGGNAPWLYRLLAHLPVSIVRTGSVGFGRIKRFINRVA